jgi:hypothetical protein
LPDGRSAVVSAVTKTPGKHMVFVAHLAGAQPELQFVQNPADIDGARVIFVHARDAESNTALANHFADRSVWGLSISPGDASLQLVADRSKQ